MAFIHAIGPAVSDGGWYAIASSELTEPPDDEISQVLDSRKGRASIPAESQTFVPVHDPGASLTDAAPDWAPDLFVVGSHGREGVTRQAPCPEIVRK